MRIMHVGWGFSPWRDGGLLVYSEDLMSAQVERGHEVSYFLSGRHYPYVSGPRLKRWRRRGVAMHELVNPPIVPGLENGTREPELDVAEPRTEAAFRRVLEDVRPDVVHIQELHGLPSSLIELTAGRWPALMTLHDYGPLCATLRLFDADGGLCMRREVGADCVARNADAPVDRGYFVSSTMNFEAGRLLARLRLDGVDYSRLEPLLEKVRRRVVRTSLEMEHDEPARIRARRDGSARAAGFQRRRDVNVERLGRVDRLLAQSPRLAEIYRTLGVSGARMTVLPAPARHIEHLRPRRRHAPPSRVTFVTLNGCASPSKGSETVTAALRSLRDAGLEGSFRLRVLGHVHPPARQELLGFEGVELHGLYARDELDRLLEDADVGIVPSMWEEAYCYTGLEQIAKGIPLIANPLGGIVEYAREGETAWLNESCSGRGLAELMARVVREPRLVLEMHRRVLDVRDDLLPSWKGHVDALDGVYREVAGAS